VYIIVKIQICVYVCMCVCVCVDVFLDVCVWVDISPEETELPVTSQQRAEMVQGEIEFPINLLLYFE